MNKDNTKKISVFSILIFILCGLIAIYAVASFVSVTSYMKEMFDYGQITFAQNFYDILSYYVTNCGVYIIYICILLAIWWVSDKKKVLRTAKAVKKEVAAPAKPELEKSEPAKADAKDAKADAKEKADAKTEVKEKEEVKADAKADMPKMDKEEK